MLERSQQVVEMQKDGLVNELTEMIETLLEYDESFKAKHLRECEASVQSFDSEIGLLESKAEELQKELLEIELNTQGFSHKLKQEGILLGSLTENIVKIGSVKTDYEVFYEGILYEYGEVVGLVDEHREHIKETVQDDSGEQKNGLDQIRNSLLASISDFGALLESIRELDGITGETKQLITSFSKEKENAGKELLKAQGKYGEIAKWLNITVDEHDAYLAEKNEVLLNCKELSSYFDELTDSQNSQREILSHLSSLSI